MNSQHPIGSQNEFRSLQSILPTSSQEADYDDDDIAPVLREEDPDIEAKLDQIFGIDSRPD
jgi:hypothetical protein